MADTFVPPNLFTHQAALPSMVVDDPHPTGGIEDIFHWKCSCSLDLFYTHTGVVSDNRMAVDDSESHAQDHSFLKLMLQRCSSRRQRAYL